MLSGQRTVHIANSIMVNIRDCSYFKLYSFVPPSPDVDEHKQLQIDPEVFNALPTQRERNSLSTNIYIIQNLEDYLKKIISEIQNQFPNGKSDLIPMKVIISSVINLSCTLTYIFDELSRHDQIYGKLLLMLVLMPLEYSYECKIFSHWYHRNAIQQILGNIDIFKKLSLSAYKHDVEIQAFLLQRGIYFANAQINKRHFICDAFKFCLHDRLHPYILELLESLEDFEKINIKLSNLLSGNNFLDRFVKKEDSGNDLKMPLI